MDLQINFYSEDEISVQLKFDSENPESVIGELFVFACYTLRQFRYQGHQFGGCST